LSKAVDLGLGQGVSALLLDGVLGGQHQERFGQRVGFVAQGHLSLLHGFQERALHLGWRAVDLVGQDQVGEHRPLLGNEFLLFLVEDQGPQDVGGQEIGRELDALEFGFNGRGQGFDGQGLGQAGHAFDQDVPVGQQADKQTLHHGHLADHDLVHLGQDVLHKGAFRFDLVVDFLQVFIHASGSAPAYCPVWINFSLVLFSASRPLAWSGCSLISRSNTLSALR
jgi:hypothetical protein